MRAIRAVCLILLCCRGFSAEPEKTVALADVLKNARANGAEWQAQQWNDKIAAAEIASVKSEFSPRIKARVGAGPITEGEGDSLSSVERTGKWGVAFLGGFELNWPLWVWGRKGDYLSAVRSGEKVKKSEADEKWLEISYRLKEAYYGHLLTNSLLDFIQEGISQIRSASDENKKNKKKKKEDATRLEIFLAQAESKREEVEAARQIARLGLQIQGGFPSPVFPQEEWLSYQERQLQDLAYYRKKFQETHPKLKMIDEGIRAKTALAEAERKGSYPVFGLMAKYDYSFTEAREDQTSLFAYDPFNTSQTVIGVGFEWSWQYDRQNSKVQKLRMEKNQLAGQQIWAEKGLGALVEKAWWEVKRSSKQVEFLNEAQKEAKKWLSRELISWGSGLGDSKKLIEAFGARAQTRKDYLEGLYQYELAWAALSKSVGTEIDPLLEQHINF